jgi:hypothetical protein
MASMVPVVALRTANPPADGCTVNVLPVNTILPGVAPEEVMLASPVKFNVPVIRLALAAMGMITIAAIVNVKTLFVIGSFLASL